MLKKFKESDKKSGPYFTRGSTETGEQRMIFLWSNMYEAAGIVQSVRAGRSVVLVRVAARFLETMTMNENLEDIAKKTASDNLGTVALFQN